MAGDYDSYDEAASEQLATVPRGSPLIFWLLMGMAVVAFAPCLLLPQWRQYQALRLAEQVQTQRTEQLQGVVAAEQEKLRALRTDPAAVARLARRELHYRAAGEQFVAVDVPEVADPVREGLDAPIVLTPVRPPAMVERALARLPGLNYDNIFCEPGTRNVVMGLSGALALAALVLFRPRSATE